jgi:hypothetical protein
MCDTAAENQVRGSRNHGIGTVVDENGDCIVHSEEGAINKLRNEIAPRLTGTMQVVKRKGNVVDFDIKKLQKSPRSACHAASVDDPIFHVLLSTDSDTSVTLCAWRRT